VVLEPKKKPHNFTESECEDKEEGKEEEKEEEKEQDIPWPSEKRGSDISSSENEQQFIV